MDVLDVNTTRTRLLALSQLEEHLSFRVSRLSKLMDNHSAKNIRHPQLNLTDYRILLVLDLFHETSAADLSRIMVIDRAQISRSVAALRTGAFLEERTDPKNKRRKLLRLSAKGTDALSGEQPFFSARQAEFEDLLSPDELAGLTAAIDKLSRHLAQELGEPQAIPASEQQKP
ncbi:winged helix DNA-binding protein [Epibacterium sp. SM1979]|uniref:Winged helix DNA-binding protein n=2 Tax=Tritonibacter litoralis TaxID=2662264 RepID=A0A843YIF9_9RHOB|nr:winged helix DNA-binding protein [Tritonibacter litoralis]